MRSNNKPVTKDSSYSRREYLKYSGAASVAGITLLTGCASNGPASTSSKAANNDSNTITLGASISKTGTYADIGKRYVESYKMTVEDINQQGGVEVDGTTYKLDLILYDDQSDPAKARQLFQKLIEVDGVNFLLGPYTSGVTLAAKPVVVEHEVPMVQGGGGALEIFQNNKWIFGLLAPGPKYASTPLKLAKTFKNPDVQKVGFATENSTFPTEALKLGGVPTAKKFGMEIVINEIFPTDTSDFSSILGKVKEEDPDVFLLLGHHAILFAKQLKQFRVHNPMSYVSAGVTTHDYIQEVGATGNYIYGVTQWLKNVDITGFFYGSPTNYVKKFEKVYGYAPEYHNAAASAAVLVYLSAFRRAKNLNPKHVRDKIAKTDISTFFGPVEFKPNGVNDREPYLVQRQNLKNKLVYPDKYAVTEPVYPTPTWNERIQS